MSTRSAQSQVFAILGAALLAALLGGCSTVGPAAITSGRGAYAEAIAATNDRQILGYILGLR